jgi:hypothetical protein
MFARNELTRDNAARTHMSRFPRDVDTAQLFGTLDAIKGDPSIAKSSSGRATLVTENRRRLE